MKLNFNTKVTPRQAMRPIKDLAMGRTIGEIEVSDGVSPALATYPYKYLPVVVIDNNSDEGIVLVKGTIVSLITNQTHLLSAPPNSGIPVPTSSGSIPVTDNAATVEADWIVANIDDDFFGYEQSIIGLLIPANGGNASVVPYSLLDDTVGIYTGSGYPALSLGANMPVGMVFQDIYQDIRGFNLNYQMHDAYGFICRGFITVPFVDTNKITTFGSDADTQTGTIVSTSVYYNVWRKYAFLYFNGSNNGGSAGQALTPDKLGKFKPHGTGTSTALTVQTVALLKACDSRYPKDEVAVVQTFPDSAVTGTDTAGVPSMLYHFVRDSLTVVNGKKPTASEVLVSVQGGKFGLARLALILG